MATELNIPSAICHSCFYSGDDKLIHLGEAETNYWFALLYLYRKNLLYQNKKQTIFLDNGKKTLNPDFTTFSTKIKRSSFNSLGLTGNSSYDKLEAFLVSLYHSKLEVNILGKNKLIVSEKVEILTSLYIDEKNIIHIEFSDKLAKALLHTASYFMKVDLDFLFKLRGYTAKKLYLLVKDYYRMEKREIEIIKSDLEIFIDTVPEKKVLDKIIKGIRKANNSDITFTIEETENIIVDEYMLKLGDRPDAPIIKAPKKTKTKSRFSDEIIKEAKRRVKKRKLKGKKIDDEVAYFNTVCEDIEEENNYKEGINEWLNSEKGVFEEIRDDNSNTSLLLYEMIIDDVKLTGVYINNDYIIQSLFTDDDYSIDAEETFKRPLHSNT